MQDGTQSLIAFKLGFIGPFVGPFFEQGAVEALDLLLVWGRWGLVLRCFDLTEGLGEGNAAITRTVVGEHLSDFDAKAIEPAERSATEVGRGLHSFVGQDL